VTSPTVESLLPAVDDLLHRPPAIGKLMSALDPGNGASAAADLIGQLAHVAGGYR
jgi:hypothetical protein